MVGVALATSMMMAAVAVGMPGTGRGGTAEALVPTADFRFVDPARVWDSREPGRAVTPGVEVALPPAVGRRVVNASLFDATEPSWLYFHGCGVPVDRSRPAAAFVEAGEIEFNLAPIDPAQGCMTRFGDAGIALDLIGVQDGQPGLDYVALPSPTTIEVMPTITFPTVRVEVPVADASIPAGAEAVAVRVGVFARPGRQPQVSPCGPVIGPQLTMPTAPGGFGDNLFVVPVDPSGTVCIGISGSLPELLTLEFHGFLRTGVTPSAEGLPYSGWVEQVAPGYVALSPSRLFDTRDDGAPVAGGQVRRYRFTGLPDTATAVALNITATDTRGPGFLSAYPCDARTRPDVSNVNVTGIGQTVPNFAVVSLGSSRELCVFALTTTHVIADMAGYFVWESGDGYVPARPSRVADTRSGQPLAAGGTLVVDLAGRIAEGTSAVAVNVTATQTGNDGFLTAHPCGEPVPTASNVNYRPNETRPNLAVVKMPADRRICVYTSARTHVFVDLAGSFTASSDIGMFDAEPARVFDTRSPIWSVPQPAAGAEVTLTIDDRYLRGVAWNLTVTEPAGPGFVTGYPCAGGLPPTSNVNVAAANETTASFSFLAVDDAGALCFYALTTTHLIADEAGYFVEPLPFEVYYDGAPARVGPFTSRATVTPSG